MNIFKTAAVAFSLYSRIPMPQFAWTERDMKHAIVFLPAVGGVIGLVLYFTKKWFFPLLPPICRIVLLPLLPLLITGGFHADGYLDVQDALSSYRGPEQKRKILEDPHIGAFAVIRFAVLGLFWIFGAGLVFNAEDPVFPELLCFVFPLVRCLSAILALKLPHAKKDGMLHEETKHAGGPDVVLLSVQGILLLACMAALHPAAAVCSLAALTGFAFYYRHLCLRQFEGVTGDTAGYCTVSGETLLLVLLGLLTLWKGVL